MFQSFTGWETRAGSLRAVFRGVSRQGFIFAYRNGPNHALRPRTYSAILTCDITRLRAAVTEDWPAEDKEILEEALAAYPR